MKTPVRNSRKQNKQPEQLLPDLIPMRQAGYFKDISTKAELDEDNLLAKASIIRAPNDLE